MLSDNIRSQRKKNSLSQDELAERIGVSRQSISFWETGQTQPTIDNIIALSKVFNISTDMLLGNSDSTNTDQNPIPETNIKDRKSKAGLFIAVSILVLLLIGAAMLAIFSGEGLFGTDGSAGSNSSTGAAFDLFAYCKNFAIDKGTLNGDYCIYQQPSANYGGYENEYFSICYWSDTNVVEFCLHCPLDDTLSHNFYIKMRGGFNGKYEYVSSKYYREDGSILRNASGYIDPAEFYDGYPISCDEYIGSSDGQTDFMEQSRVGICDLIRLIKEFVAVENMECAFSDFGFVNF